MNLLEEFLVVDAPLQVVEHVLTDRTLMQRWASPAVQFTPLDKWSFEEGTRWSLTLTGLGPLLSANYVVYKRQPDLILWSYNGFWEGFDAWHWMPNPHTKHQTIIQNRLEYEVCIPGLTLIWSTVMVPLMDWDARTQMKRLKKVIMDSSLMP